MGKVLVVGLGLMFAVGGVTVGAVGWIDYQNTQDDIDNAVEVEGTVVETSIQEDEREVDPDDDGVYEDTETEYEPVVRYNYTYEGEEYTSTSVYPGSERSFDTHDEAANVTDQFTAGEPVTINVNSDDPARAFLLAEEGSLVLLAITTGAAVLGLLVGGSTIRKGVTGAESAD